MHDIKDIITKVVTFEEPPSRVWQTLTNHHAFGAWFQVKLEGPFKPGKVTTGRITFPGHEGLLWRALVARMEPESLFSFSWCPLAEDPGGDFSTCPNTTVTFLLEPRDAGTRLTITESGYAGLATFGVETSEALEARHRNIKGWDFLADHMIAHARDGKP